LLRSWIASADTGVRG